MLATSDAGGRTTREPVHLADYPSEGTPPVPGRTINKTFRLPEELVLRIEEFRRRHEEDLRAAAPEHIRAAVKVNEIEVVKLLLTRGLDALEAEDQAPKGKRRRT